MLHKNPARVRYEHALLSILPQIWSLVSRAIVVKVSHANLRCGTAWTRDEQDFHGCASQTLGSVACIAANIDTASLPQASQIGVKNMAVRGSARLTLAPLMGELPVVGAARVSLLGMPGQCADGEGVGTGSEGMLQCILAHHSMPACLLKLAQLPDRPPHSPMAILPPFLHTCSLQLRDHAVRRQHLCPAWAGGLDQVCGWMAWVAGRTGARDITLQGCIPCHLLPSLRSSSPSSAAPSSEARCWRPCCSRRACRSRCLARRPLLPPARSVTWIVWRRKGYELQYASAGKIAIMASCSENSKNKFALPPCSCPKACLRFR